MVRCLHPRAHQPIASPSQRLYPVLSLLSLPRNSLLQLCKTWKLANGYSNDGTTHTQRKKGAATREMA